MNILHYSLGLPPFRSGGLTKYSIDLMETQVSQGEQVLLLFPGHFSVRKKTKIADLPLYKGIQVFEIVNPLPVPLLNGISKTELFTEKVNPSEIYISFLKKFKPNVIHIHTLMGIHQEFFLAAKELNIPIVYTTHDYFGICPKVNLVDNNSEICSDYQLGMKCISCNLNAYRLPFIYLMQSKTYRNLKDAELVKKLKNLKKEQIVNHEHNVEDGNKAIDNGLALKYMHLRNYFFEMFNKIDYFHFNSNNTKNIYEKYLDISGEVISISHKDIKDNRMIKVYEKNTPLKITFIGSLDKYKGFPLLRESLNLLIEKNQTNWMLNIYGNSNEILLNDKENKNIILNGRYKHNDLKEIYNNTDILIVPSICKETFSFIALEALSFGVPVLVSEHVGFKDNLKHNYTGFIFKDNTFELSSLIEKIIYDKGIIQRINQNIFNEEFPYKMDEHTIRIRSLYEKVISRKIIANAYTEICNA